MRKSGIPIFMLLCLPLLTIAQVQGSGDIVKQEITLEKLSGVRLGFSGDIILTQGSTQKIVLEGQQNVLDNIKRDVDDGIWNVNFHKGIRNAKHVRIYITLASLAEVYVSGSGNISTTGTFRNLGELETGVAGSGNINLDVEAGNVEAAISGSGDITLQGTADNLEVMISGSGDVRAVDLRTTNCEVSISGSGDATLYCTSSIESAISGSGDVRYKGDPSKVRAAVNGSGDVKEIDQ